MSNRGYGFIVVFKMSVDDGSQMRQQVVVCAVQPRLWLDKKDKAYGGAHNSLLKLKF